MARRDFYIDESKFDSYQKAIIDRRSDNSLIVQGCAGSGKSILALWKAKELQNKGVSYLFVTFTKSLKGYMQSGIQAIGINSENVENYHQCFHWKNVNGGWTRGPWKTRDKIGRHIRDNIVDYIIVDEAQDLSLEEIDSLREHTGKAMILWGDSAQQLYGGRGAASMREIINHTGFPDEKLILNHRLPKKIARLAEYVNTENDNLVARCVDEGSEKPYITQYYSLEEQLDDIMEIIENQGYEDVGILFPSIQQVQEASEYYREKDYLVESKINDNITLNFDTPTPKIMPYKSAKGLQFEAVFLPECNLSNYERMNELYVAITRTYQSLYIMYSGGELSPLLESVPAELYDTLN